MRIVIVFFLIALLSACNPCRYVANHPECYPADTVITTDIVTVTDTLIYIEENQSTLDAWFECDSNNQVLIKKLEETISGIKTVTVFKDNVLK